MLKCNQLISIVICTAILLTGCNNAEFLNYYSDHNNYISVTGIVRHIGKGDTYWCIGLKEITPEMDAGDFVLEGENLKIAQKAGLNDAIAIGSVVQIITAPRYFGDGYMFPIVAMSIDDRIFLDYDVGYDNYIKMLGE